MKTLIIGGGIAGSTLAYTLRRYGHEALVAEARPSHRDTGGAFLYLAPNGINALRALGLGDVPTTAGGFEASGSVQGGGGKPRSRASNMLLPAPLHARVTAYAQATARSHGDVIMDAIEANIDELRPLFAPAPQASSGSIFGARPVRAPRPPEGPKVQLNYRLRSDYFAALEDLVVQLRAGTRTHLILTALQMYFEKIDQEG